MSGPADPEAGGEVPQAARAALARARAGAKGQAQGDRPGGAPMLRRRIGRGRYSGPGPDPRDPQPLSRAWGEAVRTAGWRDDLNAARLAQSWAGIAGESVAQHCAVESFQRASGVLVVRASSTAWAEQLRMMLPMIRAAVDAEMGSGVVRDIRVLGPAAPSWRHGRLRVVGRGPRDTYG